MNFQKWFIVLLASFLMLTQMALTSTSVNAKVEQEQTIKHG